MSAWQKAAEIWAAAEPIDRQPYARRYLMARGIKFAPATAVRYAPALTSWDGKERPAIVAAMTRVAGDGFFGVCLHWLEREHPACTADRRRDFVGNCRGGGIVLAPVRDEFAIGARIEEAQAIGAQHSLPAVAVICAETLLALELPPWMRRIVIAGQCNGGAFNAAAEQFAERVAVDGVDVEIDMPPGQYWASIGHPYRASPELAA